MSHVLEHPPTAVNALTDEFMQATGWEQSFVLLDKICDQLIDSHTAGASLPVQKNDEVLNKVAMVDCLCEKFHAEKAISSPLPEGALSEYPWFLYDYYKAESDYLKSQCDDIRTIACFGHGAIPALAMVLLEKNPDLEIDMFDIDPEVTELAKKLVSRQYPDAKVNFITADVSTFKSEKEYDVTIVTNAPLPYFSQRSTPFNTRYLFVRSSTENGALLYPRADISNLSAQGYQILDQKPDRIYGIHEWIFATRAP